MGNTPIHILIVDDDSGDRLLISHRLLNTIDGVVILEASNLDEAVEQVAENPIDIVLLDLTLTHSCGRQTLQHFKREAPNVPFVVLTGTTDGEQAKMAIDLGAQDFICKSDIGNPWLHRCILNAMQRHELQQELRRQSLRDSLTSLPNRAAFELALEKTFQTVEKDSTQAFTVVFVDLDEFKLINDCYGHGEGDRVLIEFSLRLSQCIRETDKAARFGGDEFVVLLNDIKSDEDIRSFVNRLNDALEAPMVIDGAEVFLAASVGYVSYCDRYTNVKHMLRDADTAMYEAKKAGKRTHRRFSQTMHDHVVKTVGLDTRIRQALVNEEFEVYYQPIVNLKSGEFLKFEALVRWNHPTQGIISPLTFIPHAERTGLIVPLGNWVLRTACWEAKNWDNLRPRSNLQICVNVSASQIQGPGFVGDVLDVLDDSGLAGERLTLEITETAIMENAEQSISMLQRLRDVGIRISIDDFGTGYSSLSKLHRFGFDALKIDRSFIQELMDGGYADLLVKTVLLLAESIGLDVIAEGIENYAEANRLRDMGCWIGQGYLYGKPATAQETLQRIENHDLIQPRVCQNVGASTS